MTTELAQEVIDREMQERTGYLDLGNCGLTELPDLSGMDWLETLIVSNEWMDWEQEQLVQSKNVSGTANKINNTTTPPFPGRLKKLVFAGDFLGDSWTINDVRPLSNLKSLTSLDLSNNNIGDVMSLSNLKGLTLLDLSNNNISDVRSLSNLKSLTSLYLSNNNISEVGFLSNLLSLKSLYLGSTLIRDIGFLSNLTNLTTLYLGSTKISDIGFLANLSNLTSLYLNSNHVSDFGSLSNLISLRTLDLSATQINDIGFLANFSNLTSLYLNSTQISDFESLSSLTGLKTLYLSSNKISDVGFLSNLAGLKSLNLTNNQISDVSTLENLPNLTSLNLHLNQISDLTPLLPLIRKGISVRWEEYGYEDINLHGNPLQNPPPEIVEQGNEAILRYFEKFQSKKPEEIRFVDEAKVLLIGQPRAGKTTLRHKLRSTEAEMPPEAASTQGIDIERLKFNFIDESGRNRTFKYNVWDFGGQEIYHATHRFFLTARSLYVAVVNTDVNDKQNDLDYWLHIVELLGGESPILMVQNQRDKQREVNISKDLRDRFKHLLKKEYFLNLKCLKVGEASFDGQRLKEFKQFEEELRGMLKHLPQTSIKVTIEELAVREAIAEMAKSKAVIATEEYFKLCHEKGLTDENLQKDFLHLLHELGVLLHFKNNEHLERVVILQNKWATDAVFKILDAPQLKGQHGFFNKTHSEEIWNSPEYVGKGVELRALMREFKLCYSIGETDEFIAPQLLPTNAREGYEWQSNETDLRMVVEYEFMPRGIMTQFIVGMHRDIAEGQRLVWQTGFVAEPQDLSQTRAEATESYDSRRIEIKVQGPYAGILLQRLSDELRKIHASYQNLQPNELLPCVCIKCKSLAPENRHYFKYKSLLNSLYVNRVSEKQCDKSDEQVPIEKVLGQAGFDRQKREQDARHLLENPRDTHLRVSIDNREVVERLERIEKTTISTETNTVLIQSNQHAMSKKMTELLVFAASHQAEVKKVLEKIEALPASESVDFERIDALLEEQFGNLLKRLPNEHTIVQAWKSATSKSADEVDAKWKLKFKIPFIFGELEKELTWDGKAILKMLRSELTAVANGEKTLKQLFIEE